jgi:hypothetical protein
MAQDTGAYGRWWDQWVGRWEVIRGDRDLEWPGDNWGSPEGWEQLFQSLFVPVGVSEWQRAVEIGPGSGKYTLKVLEASTAHVRAYDVSEKFLDVCHARCREDVEGGRLALEVLDTARADWLLTDLTRAGWRRTVDGFYSIDSMVHVDLQYLIAYLLTAALVLRTGGALVLTVADATTEQGFERLLTDIAGYFPGQSAPPGNKMEWMSTELVRSILERLGFDLLVVEHRFHLLVAARLNDPDRAESLERYLRPA